jgi:hypothetical protein
MKFSSKFLSLILLSLLLTSTANADFSDVNDQTDYKDSIFWMKQNQVINGYIDGTFQPDKCVSRAEFLKMLFKTLGIDSSKSTAELFPDTPSTEWYAPYIRTAREHKTINGYEDGKFRPDNCVNRAEAIKMAEFEFNNGKIPQEPASPMLTYAKDVTEDKWYHGHVSYALQSDIVGLNHATIDKSTDLGVIIFYPEKEMSRKEVAEMLYRIKTIKDNSQEVYTDSYKPEPLVLKSAEVNFQLDQILLSTIDSNNTALLEGNTFEFDVYLERPDLKLKENKKYDIEMPLTVDLPLALQPKLMYLSDVDDTDPESGSMCQRPSFPHRCSDTLINEELKLASKDYLLKITFEDDSYVAKKITVKIPTALNQPEIIAPAKDATVQNSKFNVTFKDVGADTYEVSATMCKEYGNDGINPCLDEKTYNLTRNGNTFTIKDSNGVIPSDASIEVKDGQITLKSNQTISFELDASYTIIATSTGKNSDSVKTLVRTSATKNYKK